MSLIWESADPAYSPVSAENGAELTVGGSAAPIDLTTYHPQRGGNSNGLHVTQGSAPESDRHPASALTLDRPQERNGCVAQMDMPQHDAARPAGESRASAGNSDHLWTDEHLKNCPSCYQQYWRGRD